MLVFYLPKIIVVGVLWISAIILSTWQKYNELQDPTYNHNIDASSFYVSL